MEPREFARLLWMLEYLVYDDLLRGTGWGRKRGWFRDTLDKAKSLGQVGRRWKQSWSQAW